MRQILKNTSLAAITGLSVLALSAGTAFAYSPVTINDGGFDYFSAEDGYASIDFEDGQLNIIVTDEASEGALKINADSALPLDSADADDYTASELLEYLPVSAETTGVRVLHEGTSVRKIVSGYSNLFSQEGFSNNVEEAYTNGQVMVYENDGVTARVIFTQVGGDVSVYVTTL